MSYARFGSDSDVYVFADLEGRFCCCFCRLNPPRQEPIAKLLPSLAIPGEDVHVTVYDSFYTRSLTDLLMHLEAHRAHGQKVPNNAFTRIQKELAP